MSSELLEKRNPKGPLSLVLAVTGHRDLRKEDHVALKQQVRGIFCELAESYPFTPLQLMSGLAEGADRLAAVVALECEIPLVACLPMEKSLYETDFATQESRQEFEELLRAASRIVTLPLTEGATAEKVKEEGAPRDFQYQILSEYLVGHCQILIAFWDGHNAGLQGGTSSVVRMQLGAQPDGGDINPNHPLDFPETGPVFQIVTPRIKNPTPSEEPYKIHKHYHLDRPDQMTAESYAKIFGRMDAFNRDALECGEKLRAPREQSKKWLLPDAVRAGLGDFMTSMVEHYALADALAIHYQTLTRRSLRALIFGSGLVAVFFFECFAHGPEEIQIWALLSYALLVALTYGGYHLVKPGRFKTKHLDYRALAEGLRLQIFWRLAGLKEQVVDYYLRKQKTELDWIRNAIGVWSTAPTTTPGDPEFTLVQAHWIEDQFKFFDKVSLRDHRRRENEERWTFWLLFVTMGLALVIILLEWSFKERFSAILYGYLWKGNGLHSYSMDLHGTIVIVMSMLPAIAGAIAGYSLKMAIGEQQKQYQRMRNLFSRGSECLQRALRDNDHGLAVKTILDLGKEALEENGDWVLLHRERSVEVHLGG